MSVLKPVELIKLKKFFEKYGLFEKYGTEHYDGVCDSFSLFTEEERSLLYSLLTRFEIVGGQDLFKYFRHVLSQVVDCYNGTKSAFIITPLLCDADVGKSKSSVTLFGMLRSIFYEYGRSLKIKLSYLEHVELEKRVVKTSDQILLLDDFIGTGETALAAVRDLENKGFKRGQIIVVAIYGMHHGVMYLSRQDIRVFVYKAFFRGISEESKNVFNDLLLMKRMENRIGVKEKFSLGYKQSEALVSSFRTPNNVFPVFWFRNKKSKFPLFPRK